MSVENYWPTDTRDTIYLPGEFMLDEVFAKCQEKFGAAVKLEQIMIHSQHIHVYNTTYDLYVPSDYATFIVCVLDNTE